MATKTVFERTSRDVSTWILVGLLVSIVAGAGTVGFIAATPSTSVPVGITEVVGDSMTPTFSDGSVSVYVDVEPEVGDVVVFRAKPDTYVIHRIVKKTEYGFVTQGDNEAYPDQVSYPYVKKSNYAGRVLFVVDSRDVLILP